jgi:hypothetical protein
MEIEPYDDTAAEAWDDLVARAPMGTFLHTRRFLSYHGDRFVDASVVVRDDRGRLVGVLPAAVDPDDPAMVTSHPGSTFGGLLHTGGLRGASTIDALAAVAGHFAEAGFARLRYRAVPHIYHRGPNMDDSYALFRLGATRSSASLNCVIDLAHRRKPSSRRQRGRKKAEKSGVAIERGPELARELWPVLIENLATRHGATPVHSLAEIELHIERFPDQIQVVVARLGDDVIAGVVLFVHPLATNSQYIASSAAGYDVGALDLVMDRCIAAATEEGARYFAFGTSNRDGGRVLDEGLYEFKAGFGGGGVSHDVYDLELKTT